MQATKPLLAAKPIRFAIGQGIFFGLGALLLLIALIFAVLQHHYRNRAAVNRGDEIVAVLYRKDKT
jgi:hypothetical protein